MIDMECRDMGGLHKYNKEDDLLHCLLDRLV